MSGNFEIRRRPLEEGDGEMSASAERSEGTNPKTGPAFYLAVNGRKVEGSEAAREGLRKAAPPLPRPFPQAARFSQSPESRFASGALSPAHCQYAQRFPSQVHDQDQQKPRGDLCRELERERNGAEPPFVPGHPRCWLVGVAQATGV